MILGNTNLKVGQFSLTGLLPSVAELSSSVQLTADLVTSAPRRCAGDMGPTTPIQQHHRVITLHRFRLFPFRSPLLRESLLLSFPQGTEMFQFPWLPLPALCVQTGVTGHDPSRVSPLGHPRLLRSLGSFPRLIAACYVLHRLLVPRHPPLALSSLDRYKNPRQYLCSLCSSQVA